MKLHWPDCVFILLIGACGAISSPAQPSRPPPLAEESPRFPLVVPEAPPRLATESVGSAGPELVLQGGHVGWIHDTALSPDGRLAALLSLDMPNMGQEMTPALPYATLTLIDTTSNQTRASWRFRTPDLGGAGRVHFSLGEQIMTEGQSFRSWDLRSGELTTVSSRGQGWMIPSPSGRLVADVFWQRQPGEYSVVPDERELEVRRVNDGQRLWSTSVTIPGDWRGASGVAWHPFGDGRLALASEDGLRLIDGEGQVMARDAIVSLGLHFRPQGGALYARSEGESLVLEPQTLRALGPAPWRSVLAMSADGRRIVGSTTASLPALFDARTGEQLAELPLPADVDWSETQSSPRAFAFTPDGRFLWTAWHVSAALSLASEGVDVPAAEDGASDVAEDDEPWIDFVALQSWNARDGQPGRTFYRSLEQPIPSGGGPLSLWEVGPELVASNDRLIVGLMRRVAIFSLEGELLHESVDPGIETLISGAAEAPDGRGLALVSPAALGWFGSNGASSLLCPGLAYASPRIRIQNGSARSFAQRYACSSDESAPSSYEAILGVSADGDTLVVARGDTFSGGGTAWVVSGRRRRRLPGISTWCQVDGCGPEATFVPGGQHLAVDGKLFNARTGRLVREVEHGGTYSDDGALVALRGVVVNELVSGRMLYENPHGLPPEDERPWISPRFSPDAHLLAFPVFEEGRSKLVVADLHQGRSLWELPLEHDVRQLWFNDRHVIMTTGDEERMLHVIDALTGEHVGEPSPVPTTIRASADSSRLAWCARGRLHVANSGQATRTLGPCHGRVLHVGEHFVVSADGGLARVTRLTNGRSLRLRLAVYPGRMAWTVAEDEAGSWVTPPRAFGAYLLRSNGNIGRSALSAVSAEAPGYAPNLVEEFFSAN